MGNYYTKLFFCFLFSILSTLTSITGYAANSFNKIVFFGDSLSDNGNFFNDVYGFMPKSPPYFNGRFTNGPTWAEHVEKYFFDKAYVATSNYAIGGQTAVFHNPMGGYLPYTLTMSLDNYLLHSIFTDRSNTLFVIWIGANDYLPGVANIDELTTKVVASIKSAVDNLVYYGGTNILILNLPDLSKTPFGRTSEYAETLHAATVVHNLKLDAAVSELKTSYPDANLHLYQVDNLFDDFVEKTATFNATHNTHIKNVSTSCWTGGYTLRGGQTIDESRIRDRFMTHMQSSKGLRGLTNNTPDGAELAHFIATTPALMEAYQVSDDQASGLKPCINPEDYLFWDKVHPTATSHKVISEMVIPFINEHYTVATP